MAQDPTEGLTNLSRFSMASNGISFVNAADFMAKTLPPPDWIIPDLIAVGMKCDLIGKSKTRKTFMSIQLANCVATGHDFLCWHIPEPRPTAYLNLELMDYFLHERLARQTYGLKITSESLRNLTLANIRGKGKLLREMAPDVIKELEAIGCVFVIIDPQYKLLTAEEDENSGAGMQGILDFRDILAEHFAVLLVAHDTKGEVGHKAITDRGAGTGFLGRDFDFRFVITPHGDGDESHMVVSTANRNRKSTPDFTVKFDEETRLFACETAIEPVRASPATQRNNASNRDKVALNENEQTVFRADALAIAEEAGDKLLGKAGFRSKLDLTPSGALSVHKKERLFKTLVESGVLKEQPELERKGRGEVVKKFHGLTYVSTPERIAEYLRQFETLDV